MGKELTADMNPKEVLLSSRQVPGCIGACGMQVEPHLGHCRINEPILPFKQFTVEEHCEVGDACQARDGFITRGLQDFYRGGVLHLFLLAVALSRSPCPWLVELGVARCGIELIKAFSFGDCSWRGVCFWRRVGWWWYWFLFTCFGGGAGQEWEWAWETLGPNTQSVTVPSHIMSYPPTCAWTEQWYKRDSVFLLLNMWTAVIKWVTFLKYLTIRSVASDHLENDKEKQIWTENQSEREVEKATGISYSTCTCLM